VIRTLADLRTDYLRLLPFLKPNVPETILGEFWYSFSQIEYARGTRTRQDLKFGHVKSNLVVDLSGGTYGAPEDFMLIWIGQRQPGERIVTIHDHVMSACTTRTSNPDLERVLATSQVRDFFATIERELVAS
jgi:hypothetical protein